MQRDSWIIHHSSNLVFTSTSCKQAGSCPNLDELMAKESTTLNKPIISTPTFKERRRMNRRNISYYLPVMDSVTKQVIGHIMNLSPIGMMMDSQVPIPANQKFGLHMDLMEEIAGQASLEFVATSIWCLADSIQPFLYNAGFSITEISPADLEVVKQIAEKYGKG